jgi:hypothetical protein
MAAKWEPDPSVRGLLNALRKAEQRHDRKLIEAARGRDADGARAILPELRAR